VGQKEPPSGSHLFFIGKDSHNNWVSLAKVARKWGRWCLGHWLPLPGAAARPPNR
jgi:hypothetical protein